MQNIPRDTSIGQYKIFLKKQSSGWLEAYIYSTWTNLTGE